MGKKKIVINIWKIDTIQYQYVRVASNEYESISWAAAKIR